MDLLLNQAAEVNALDQFGHTPLHMAAANWATGCADALIPHVCSLDVADGSGRTPLHHASHSGHAKVLSFLFCRFEKYFLIMLFFMILSKFVTNGCC